MSTQGSIPGYEAGTWVIDSARSEVAFQVRMLGFMKTRGTFDAFEGTVVLADNPLDSSVNAVIQATSINTKHKRRDQDIQHAGYLDTGTYPTITFASTGVRTDGADFLVDGDLTALAVTKQSTLRLKVQGIETGADGRKTARFSATTEVSNKAIGVTKGSAFINDTSLVFLEIVATKQD
ncbi:YceI family protein [Actinacidiphila bryophytorum]|uniref:Polyisoprenoid-binding protein YceI n=1 Tax=Actinacidiphila bryophytorum TaxID=1436133 RepID=A0A9W4MGX1_9ACTN|nr:YceI family protein [Actinacidiphila bryophytorum]MBM9434936.1 YceI family protein [Actinacidiphila bryophytorum]MBN6544865.1 YceI family protein [Actinacidiphila bryophytorum]CAG7641515.1 Polyisoprenoid-binding protein YceI [Actinacidiphila bryophytorum]